MPDDLLIRVDAQVQQFNAAFGSATRSTLQLEAALKRASAQQQLYESQLKRYGAEATQTQSALARAQMSNARLAEQSAAIQARAAAEQRAALQAQSQAYSRLGRTYATVGGGIALALGASAKAAVDWQQAFTRVRQALTGSPEQIAAVESGLRDLARTLPVTHDSLAEIARDASQLGVATPNIVEFTRVVAELSTTAPDLQDGATSLARFLNVTGTSQDQVENVASTLTKLGQAGASSVSEIVNLGLRLAAAGRTADLTDGQILGLANAMSSLGIQAEAGGTNFSKTILQINTAVGSGGAKLKAFADIAGESAGEFADQYRDNAGQAILAFLTGLERLRKSGGDVATALAGLGVTGLRQIDVISRLSQNTDQLAESMETGNRAFADNTALQETFGKQAETTASQMQVAANNVRDLGIGIGETLLPPLGDAAGALTSISSALGGLPGPTKDFAAAAAAATAAVTLFSGASLLLKGRLIEMQLAAKLAERENIALAGSFALASKSSLLVRGGLVAAGLGLQQFGGDIASAFGGAEDNVHSLANVLSTGLIAGAVTGNPWVGLGAAVAATFVEAAKAGGNLDQVLQQLNSTAANLGGTLDKAGLFTDATVPQLTSNLAQVAPLAARVGISLTDLTKAAAGNADAWEKVNRQAAGYGPLSDLIVGAVAAQRDAIRDQRRAILEDIHAQGALSDAALSAGGIQGDFASSIYATHGPLLHQAGDLGKATRALASYNSELARFLGKRVAIHQAILDAEEAAKKQADGFRLGTQAGIDNTNVLLNLQSATEKLDASTKSGARGFELIAQEMISFQVAQGRSRQEAIEHTKALLNLADSEVKVKKNGDIVVKVSETGADDTNAKLSAAQRLIQSLDGSTAHITISALVQTATNLQAAQAARSGRWTGGYTGDGGKFEPAGIVHRGEFVFDKASTSRLGADNLMAMMRAARGYASGGLVGYAGGGEVRGGGILTLAELLRIVARPEAVATLAQVNRLYREREAEERALQPLLRAQRQAREEERRVSQDDAATKREQAQAARDLAKAEKAVSDQRDDLRDATDRWREAQRQLVADMRASIQQTVDLASPFGGEGTSLSAQGLLAKQRDVASAAREMRVDLGILKRKGLDREWLDELRAQPPTADTLTLLRSLVREPRSYFRDLNQARDRVDRNATSLATFGVPGAGRTTIHTQVQRQVVIHQHGVKLGPTERQLKRVIRDAALHGMQIAGAP